MQQRKRLPTPTEHVSLLTGRLIEHPGALWTQRLTAQHSSPQYRGLPNVLLI